MAGPGAGTDSADLERMHRHRRERLREQMDRQAFDALVLVGPTNVEYAGVAQPCADAMRLHHEPVVVIVPASGPVVVHTRYPEGVRAGSGDVVAPPVAIEHPEGVEALVHSILDHVPGATRVGFDEQTAAMVGALDGLLDGAEVGDATAVTGAARLVKSPDEVACLHRSQQINEAAMYDVEAALRPGVRQSELSAIFFERIFELGATANIIDPIWNLTPVSLHGATATTNGDVGFPLASNDRFLREGDLVLCDTGMSYLGYHSDFGKTWICSLDPRPGPGLVDCYRRWREVLAAVLEVIKPGATCGDLVRAARRVEAKYGLDHFYLGHGVGCDSAEMPIIGSRLGLEFDDTVELAARMTFVLEPVVWRDGVGGYRSEELVVVTPSGHEVLSSYGYTPFE